MASTVFRPGDRPLLHLGLFLLTIVTTFVAFRITFADGLSFGQPTVESLRFSLCLVAILGSHEMGHYLFARYHGVDSSLPYFIPSPPFITFGTLGAVIRLRGRIPNRNALVDIGAAGPLAGLAVALPILIYGTATLKTMDMPYQVPGVPGPASLISLSQQLWTWLHGLGTGAEQAAQAPVSAGIMFGDSLLTAGLKHLFLGPLPPGKDVQENAAYLAGWFGLVVTTLNLFPIGQLDGGHLTHALFGDRAIPIGRAASWSLLALAVFFSASWVLWFIIATRVVGYRHPPVVDETQPLSRRRRWVCALSFVALAICVMPAPLTTVTA
ncbi:MAG TPA: site-2 protease family protein [Myxococcaceae bacterium]|jgi:membrane-associated protease RseP (regulator of RpoE activity)